jgi:hypothetical protein
VPPAITLKQVKGLGPSVLSSYQLVRQSISYGNSVATKGSFNANAQNRCD